MVALQCVGILSTVLMWVLLVYKKRTEKKEKYARQMSRVNAQSGAALEFIDNDQIGPLLS
jgi:type II secretory pathway pseudopilin PulG